MLAVVLQFAARTMYFSAPDTNGCVLLARSVIGVVFTCTGGPSDPNLKMWYPAEEPLAAAVQLKDAFPRCS
ncbi:MAG: hypothetical protein U0V45_05115 [Flavobacteriales bacterium]